MIQFDTSLTRERFTIQNAGGQVIAASNRIVCPLYNRAGNLVEEFVIRGQNMHSCIRMLARILQSYAIGGTLMTRSQEVDWAALWRGVRTDFDKNYNQDVWIAIYFKGQVIFQEGDHHPFFEMIEKMAAQQKNVDYENVVSLAEDTFRRGGKDFDIDHITNVAFVVNAQKEAIRCGLMVRSANRATTLSITIPIPEDEQATLNVAPFISNAAAYAEALQIAYIIGRLSQKSHNGEIEAGSDEARMLREARARMRKLEIEITNLETSHKVKYRPERPDFNILIEEAKNLS